MNLIEKPSTGIFKHDFVCDVTEIQKYVKTLSESTWNEWTIRQDMVKINPNHPHKDTKSIKIIWFPHKMEILSLEFRDFGKIHSNMILSMINPVVEYLENFYNGVILRMILTNLPKGKSITPHFDNGLALETAHRIHLPIITSNNTIFNCGTDCENMLEGHLYEINNNLIHSVKNEGTSNRVHLIIDILEKNSIGKTNENT